MRRVMVLFLAVACSGADLTPHDALASFLRVVRSQAERVPNYTCVQTLDRNTTISTFTRTIRTPGCYLFESPGFQAASKFTMSERYRLDVRVGREAEMFSWVGADTFDSRPLGEFLDWGPASTGPFGTMLSLVATDVANFRFTGVTTVAGQRAFTFDFEVPFDHSHYSWRFQDRSEANIGYRGSVSINVATGAPQQLTIAAGTLPAQAACCRFATVADYSLTVIDGEPFHLPSKAWQTFLLPDGRTVEHEIAFSNCRAFTANSSLSFNPKAPGDAPPVTPHAPPPRLDAPAGQIVTIAMTSRVDGDTAAAGDPFTARLTTPILDEAQKVIAPPNTVVRGRVARVLHQPGPQNVIMTVLVLRVETAEIDGHTVSIQLAPYRDVPPRPSGDVHFKTRGIRIGEFPRLETGSFVVNCVGPHCVADEGYVTRWWTR